MTNNNTKNTSKKMKNKFLTIINKQTHITNHYVNVQNDC